MSRKHKKQEQKFQLIDGKPMHIATQWFLVGAVAATAAMKMIEASMEFSTQLIYQNPLFVTSNIWCSIFG